MDQDRNYGETGERERSYYDTVMAICKACGRPREIHAPPSKKVNHLPVTHRGPRHPEKTISAPWRRIKCQP